ncbi:MAG: signal peptide peptidase SppA, partial [Pseudomonadota bacterium]
RRLGRILVGTLAVVGLLTLTLVGVAIWGLSHLDRDKPLPKRMVMTLDLEAEFQEGESGDPFRRFQGDKVYVLREVVAAIDRAAKDERVTGLFATIGDPRLGMAGAQEVRDAVLRFRASGKPAVVFAETLGEAGGGTIAYYLASAFGEVWLQPSGDVGVTGFLAESPFFRGTLDMLGIQPRFSARHEYKSAIEAFTETGFSEKHAESLNALLDSWMDQAVTGVAAARRLPPEKVRPLLGNGPLLAAEALSAGLVDKLGYRDDALAAASGLATKPKEVDAGDYAARLSERGGTRVAVITGTGAIHRGESDAPFGADGFGSDTIAEAFRDAIDDPEIKAILFRVDSPGGSYVASDTIWHEVRRARAAGKPVVASMGEVAASGGYFVAMAADRVVAQPGTITGSIGVFSGKFVLADFWNKLGVTWDRVERGDNAGMWSFNRDFSPQAWDRLNLMLDRIYDDFVAKAAQGRNLPAERMDAVARGRIWTGADAQKVGLVDVLGGYDVALAEVRKLLKLSPDDTLDLETYPKAKEPWQVLARALGGMGAGQAEMRTLARVMKVLEPVAEQVDAAGPGAGMLRMPPLATGGR